MIVPQRLQWIIRCVGNDLRVPATALTLGLAACGGPGRDPSLSATPAPSPTGGPSPTPHTAATYYVSPSGNDSWSGTAAQPFATIQAGVNRLDAGDILYIASGVYHEAVSVGRSGTAEAPIRIEASPGQCPTIVGTRPVAGPWTVHSGAIYEASWPSQPLQVFSDGRLLNEARWPNTPVEDFAGMTYAVAESGTKDFIAHSGLPPVDLTGAWAHVLAGEAWVVYDRTVSSHDRATGRLSFSKPINAMSQLVPRRGTHFYVFGKLELLDAPGEWWWDSGLQRLYVWMPDGGAPSGRVEAGTASPVLSLAGRSYVSIKGLSARGGWFNLQGSTHCTVEDFHLWAPNWIRTVDGFSVWPQHEGGVDVSGSGNVLRRGSVRLAGRESIHVAGSGNTVQQVTVEDSGWTWAAGDAIDLTGAEQALVENCTVRRSAAGGIWLAPHSRVVNNLVEQACVFFEDCGNIGDWSADGAGTEVAGNVIRGNHSRWGAGIYLDYGSRNFDIHDNLIEQTVWGGLNITGPNIIENNTVRDFQHLGINFVPLPTDVSASWSAGRVAHNQIAEPFPLTVQLDQPTASIPDYAYYQAYTTLAPQPGPRRVELDWPQFVQPGWGPQPVPMDLSHVDSVTFLVEVSGASFAYTIRDLRLLPVGASGDALAVPVIGATWKVQCAAPSSCTLSASGPVIWGTSGSQSYGGSNRLTAPLLAGTTDLTRFRGLAFEVAGTASRRYDHQGYQDVDNGSDGAPGRGARLSNTVGADPSGAWPACSSGLASASSR
jgi:hypothetical protein